MSALPVVPLNRPLFDEREERYVAAALSSRQVSGDGPFTARCSQLLEELLGVRKVLLTTSCTHALEMAALLLDIGPGDEVIAPSFTFVSTLNPFVLRGARPIFADIRPDTLNLDETGLERLATAKTKVILPVHYAGVGCHMEVICNFATQRNIAVVEDNAHGLFGKHGGRLLGTFGELAAQSFHETKNLSCGEGGALLINDSTFQERAEIIRNKGTDRTKFLRGEVDKYTWVDLGSSYLPSDILAAVLLAQLEKREEIHARRRAAWEYYERELSGWAAKWDVRMPAIPVDSEHPYHIFYLLLPTNAIRDSLMMHLRVRRIQSAFHFLPLHLSDMGRRFGGREGLCPTAEKVAGQLLRLPLHPCLTSDELARVVAAVTEFAPGVPVRPS
jgi:dTDP-4-amino-4,6-dideoxygalactose transaminase